MRQFFDRRSQSRKKTFDSGYDMLRNSTSNQNSVEGFDKGHIDSITRQRTGQNSRSRSPKNIKPRALITNGLSSMKANFAMSSFPMDRSIQSPNSSTHTSKMEVLPPVKWPAGS